MSHFTPVRKGFVEEAGNGPGWTRRHANRKPLMEEHVIVDSSFSAIINAQQE
jgi:hypothetical protein